MLVEERPGLWAAGWFLAGVAMVAIVIGPLAPRSWLSPATAAPACIENGDFGQILTMEDVGSSYSDDSRGTRSSMYVPLGPTDCQRISSVYVYSPDLRGSFEFGWVIGYSNCSATTYRNPTLFWYGRLTTGESRCGVWDNRHPTELQFDTFRVSDTNANTYWGSYFQGNELQPDGINMDFARGWSAGGMERGAGGDSGYAHWDDLSEYHDGNDWSLWDDANRRVDNDPDYHHYRIDAHTVASLHD